MGIKKMFGKKKDKVSKSNQATHYHIKYPTPDFQQVRQDIAYTRNKTAILPNFRGGATHSREIAYHPS